MMTPPELPRDFPGLPLDCAINTSCGCPSLASILRIFLFFFFFIWRPSVVVVWLGEAVVVVAARLVLHEVDAIVSRRCLLLLPPWKRVFDAMIFFCVFLAGMLPGSSFDSIASECNLRGFWLR